MYQLPRNRVGAPFAVSSASVSFKIFLPPSREIHQESVSQQENLTGFHGNPQLLYTKQQQHGGFSALKYFLLVKQEQTRIFSPSLLILLRLGLLSFPLQTLTAGDVSLA